MNARVCLYVYNQRAALPWLVSPCAEPGTLRGKLWSKEFEMLHERDQVKAFGPEPNAGANALVESQLRSVEVLRVTNPVGYQTLLQTLLLTWRRTRHSSSSSCDKPHVLPHHKLTSGTEWGEHGLAGRLCVSQQGSRVKSTYTCVFPPTTHCRCSR